jgi:transposase
MKGWYWTPAQSRSLEAEMFRTRDAGLFRRLLALWHVARGHSVEEVAQWLRVDRSSICRWMERFASTGNPKILEDRRGQRHAPDWEEDCEALLESALAQTPIQMGYPATQWTVPVLQAFLATYLPEWTLSTDTVRRHLRALGYVWKRFRYVLAPDPEVEKKTLPPAPDSSFAPGNRPVGRG